VNNIYPKAQIEDRELPSKPVCANETVGDILECEQKLAAWGCIISNKFDIFMRRATNDKQSVILDPTCLPEDLKGIKDEK